MLEICYQIMFKKHLLTFSETFNDKESVPTR